MIFFWCQCCAPFSVDIHSILSQAINVLSMQQVLKFVETKLNESEKMHVCYFFTVH